MHVRVDTNDLNAFARELDRAATTVAPKAKAIVKKVGLMVEGSSKTLAPVDTGALKNSISTDFIDAGTSFAAEIGPTVEYGHYVEEGTSRMSGQPYMAPALAKHEPTFHKAMARLRDTLL